MEGESIQGIHLHFSSLTINLFWDGSLLHSHLTVHLGQRNLQEAGSPVDISYLTSIIWAHM